MTISQQILVFVSSFMLKDSDHRFTVVEICSTVIQGVYNDKGGTEPWGWQGPAPAKKMFFSVPSQQYLYF
jgi:hypothetical protein